MARPKKEIDKKLFENLCKLQCTKIEICDTIEVSDKTLDRWCNEVYEKSFSEVFKQKRTGGTISLRRSQFKLAEKNATMAIWLGKQYLGQKDEQEIKMNAEVNNPFKELSTEELKVLANKGKKDG